MVNEPKVVAEQRLSLLGEVGAIAGGKSERAPKPGDKRCSDPAWKDSGSPGDCSRLTLLGARRSAGSSTRRTFSEVDKARAHLITETLIDAVAPTDAMLTNPAAVRKFVNTGGESLRPGTEELL